MRTAAPTGRSWAVATAVGVLALAGFAYLIRVPESHVSVSSTPAPSVALVDPVVTRATSLRDPTPLFLPTEFNSSRQDYVASAPTGGFAGFPPRFEFDAAQLELNLPPPAVVPASPAEALAGDPLGAPFASFGRSDIVVQAVAKRDAYIEICETASGRKVYGAAVADAHPPAASMPWQPMEFLAAVDAAGLVGPLVPTARSGVDAIDNYFGSYLAETLRVGQRLAPGFYRISVGP